MNKRRSLVLAKASQVDTPPENRAPRVMIVRRLLGAWIAIVTIGLGAGPEAASLGSLGV